MATAKISWIIEGCKRKTSVQKWIIEQKEFARKLAYEKRSTINKRELEDDLKKLDCTLPLWELFKKLRKKSTDYDCLIDIDKQGYISIQIIFPILQEELDKAFENKASFIHSNGTMYSQCSRIPEEVWKVSHERINKVFNAFILRDYGAYQKYSTNPLIRWTDLVTIK